MRKLKISYDSRDNAMINFLNIKNSYEGVILKKDLFLKVSLNGCRGVKMSLGLGKISSRREE